ncbi:MAG: class II fructose-bisphosphate aldolase, partial [Gemmatimonadota bacterium]|nr:class II fructose-bisphosphate aldolase [Gemmatimonadota bacterium]
MQAQGTASASAFGDDIDVQQGRLTVRNEDALRTAKMDTLVREAVFGEGQARDHANWMIWETAQAVGVRPASIHDLYAARGRGDVKGFTVPAMNVRGLSYDTARAIFRTAVRMHAGAFILEIARSEIAYTAQRPSEYVTVMLAAALREGFRGPVFIQGDHFQVNAKKFAADPTGEVAAVKQLALEAVSAGFYNIDVDTSTLVDIHLPTLDAQQELNYETAAEIAAYVRSIEPEGVTISIGGEIGEVGTQNSTLEELETYMDGFNETLDRRAPGTEGLSK